MRFLVQAPWHLTSQSGERAAGLEALKVSDLIKEQPVTSVAPLMVAIDRLGEALHNPGTGFAPHGPEELGFWGAPQPAPGDLAARRFRVAELVSRLG